MISNIASITTQRQYFIFVTLIVVAMVLYWEFYGSSTSRDWSAKKNQRQDIFNNVLHNSSIKIASVMNEDDWQRLGILEEQEDNYRSETNQNKTVSKVEDSKRNLAVISKQELPHIRNLKQKTNSQNTSSSQNRVTNWTSIHDSYRFQSKPYTAYWVSVDAPFLERIQIYNRVISHLRRQIKNHRGFKNWQDPPPSPTVVWGSSDNFLGQLSNFTDVRTVALSWLIAKESEVPSRNLLVNDYYQWVGSEPLCSWIKTPGSTKARWDAVYNRTCTTDIEKAIEATNLEPVYSYGKPINPDHYWPNKGLAYPAYFYSSPPPHVLYLHIAEDSVITSVGDVFSGSVKIVPYSCSHDRTPSKPEGYGSTAIYSEIFIMSGHWGNAHFHKSVELLPRIAPYLEFMVENPTIMVHVSETGGMTARILDMLGISKERLVSGTIRAKMAYMPQGTPCGFAQVQGAQMLSWKYRKYIHDRLQQKDDNVHYDSASGKVRKNLVVIHRSGMRRFSDSITIEMKLKEFAEEFGLNFFIYHDQQLPSLEDTMLMFNNAVMVVAPHGAGESNIMFCEPGTYIVEAVCNPPHVNMCYQWLAHILGHRYHAVPSNDGCEGHIEVNVKILLYAAKAYLQQWKSRQK